MDHRELKLKFVKRDSFISLSESSSSPASPSPLTTGTTVSSNNTLPSTPDLESSGSGYFFLQKLDDALKREIDIPKLSQPLSVDLDNTIDPYAEWKCAFGFSRQLGQPDELPADVTNFMGTIKKKLNSIQNIQNGLVSYTDALYSGTYHNFDQEFLVHETNAARTTTAQLDEIAAHLKQVMMEINANSLDSTVKPEQKEAIERAQPWIMRARANLVSAHVFYKVNFVLGGKKMTN